MHWQIVLDNQAAYTHRLIQLFDDCQYEAVRLSLRTASEEFREAFTLWVKHHRPQTKACNYPDQLGDADEVSRGITWGQLFGRRP